MSNHKVIDLFAGCGGLSLGFAANGFDIKAAVEYDATIAGTYKKNHPNVDMIVDDIKNIDTLGVLEKYGADIIIGGQPCQGFSMAGARIRAGFIDDPRNYLFKHYFNVVKAVCPKVFIIENVKGITTMQEGKIFEEIIRLFSSREALNGKPYFMWHKLVRAVDFGVPQKRERMIIIGIQSAPVDMDAIWHTVRKEISIQMPHFFDKVTVADAIGNLPAPTKDGNVSTPKPITEYQKYLATTKSILTNHTLPHHQDIAIKRMDRIGNVENYEVLNEKINSIHSGSYGRLLWDEPSQTITTRFDTPSGGRFIHPKENRTLTPREAARLQSFSDSFVFTGTKSSICKQIGNAVPPKVSYFLARLVKKILEEL